MPFTIHPLLPTDAPACATIYFAAFQNAHSLACWPRTPAIRAFWEKMIVDELREPESHWLKVVDEDEDDRDDDDRDEAAGRTIVGFCKWQRPKPGVLPPGEEELPVWPEGADAGLCDETFGAWARGRREIVRTRGHWYLEILATDPQFQGRGAGSMLIRWGTEQADAGGWEAYLEASPDAVRLYEKLGFRDAGRVDTFINNERVKDTWYTNLFMIREANAKSS